MQKHAADIFTQSNGWVNQNTEATEAVKRDKVGQMAGAAANRQAASTLKK